MYNRSTYMDKLLSYKDKTEIIKVLTGIRRCGKSTLLELYKQYLLDDGVKDNHIIHIRFESLEHEDLKTYKELNEYILERINTDGINYILLDEVQYVENWERAVNSLHLMKNTDIIITGSNAYMLSSDLSTLISGRYVEIMIYPLSFREFLDFNQIGMEANLDAWLQKYIEIGGFPGLIELVNNPNTIDPFLIGILNTILMKDVTQKNAVRDPILLENILRFLAKSISSPVSIKRITDYLISSGRKTTFETVDSYVTMLEKSYLIYRAKRYDIKGLALLKTNDKLYLTDLGLRRILLRRQTEDYGVLLENIVFFELLRRGYHVEVGKYEELEVDFVATKNDERKYIQVTASLLNEETKERELKPLRAIPDFNQRIVLSSDHLMPKNSDGIKLINIIDFLLANEE
ncbi:MAG: ATP-binding protein [Clostridia bacterium]|nr:ATP-binding protein [Clostridia bacterium]